MKYNKLQDVYYMDIKLRKKWNDPKTLQHNMLQNFILSTHPVSKRSGTPYGPFLVFNTAVPDGSGRRGGY